MVLLFGLLGVVFGLLAAVAAYLITYEEWSRHLLPPGVAVRRSVHLAAVALGVFLACSLAACWFLEAVVAPR